MELDKLEEAIKIVRKFNQENRYRDCGKTNNSIDMILQALEDTQKQIKQFYDGELYTANQLKKIEENQKKYFINKQVVKENIRIAKQTPRKEFCNYDDYTFGKIRALEELLEE